MNKSTQRVNERNQALAEKATAAGWGSVSEFLTAVKRGRVDLPKKTSPKAGPLMKGIYCPNCEVVVEWVAMKPWMKDNDVLDLLCPGCDRTLIEGE